MIIIMLLLMPTGVVVMVMKTTTTMMMTTTTTIIATPSPTDTEIATEERALDASLDSIGDQRSASAHRPLQFSDICRAASGRVGRGLRAWLSRTPCRLSASCGAAREVVAGAGGPATNQAL
jgi:hypothetical protein